MPLRLRTTELSGLSHRLRDRWRQIHQQESELANPVLAPEFATCVARHRPDAELAIIEADKQPVGFFPYHRKKNGIARPIGDDISDMHGVVIDPSVDWDIKWLLRGLDLQAFHFDHLVGNNNIFGPHIRWRDECPIVELSGGFDAYRKSLINRKSSVLKQIARKRRKLSRDHGDIEFEFFCGDSTLVTTLLRWKREQLQQQGLRDTLNQSWIEPFVRDLLQSHEGNEFRGVLSMLRAGGNPVAAHLGVAGNGVFNSWIPAHDPEYSLYSPGAILHVELAKYACDFGIKRLDLGRGQNQLKCQLMTNSIPLAIGTVDLRKFGRIGTSLWYRCRGFVESTSLQGWPLATYRRIRHQWL